MQLQRSQEKQLMHDLQSLQAQHLEAEERADQVASAKAARVDSSTQTGVAAAYILDSAMPCAKFPGDAQSLPKAIGEGQTEM